MKTLPFGEYGRGLLSHLDQPKLPISIRLCLFSAIAVGIFYDMHLAMWFKNDTWHLVGRYHFQEYEVQLKNFLFVRRITKCTPLKFRYTFFRLYVSSGFSWEYFKGIFLIILTKLCTGDSSNMNSMCSNMRKQCNNHKCKAMSIPM